MRAHNYNVLCANAPGTGKTIEALACIGIDREKLTPAIVVAPASVAENWKVEANKWLPWARVHLVKNRSQPLPRTRCHIYIVSWSLLADRALDLLSVRPKFLIADEAHFAKNEDAARSRILYGLARRIPHRLLLTGTPVVNNEQELVALKSLFPNNNPPILRRFLEDAAPDIPPKTRCVIPIQLPPKFQKEYYRAQDEFSEWLAARLRDRMEGGDAEAAHQRALAAEALVKIGYLRRLVGRAKTNAAVDWAARAVRVGEPVILFAEHHAVIERLSKSLSRQRLRHIVLDGSTPKRKRLQLIEQFQNGEVPIFVGSKAAGTGVTLHRARHLLFVEYFWTSADLDQAEDRIRRIGQKHPTKMWYLHAPNTIDDRLCRIIARKRGIMAQAVGIEHVEDTLEESVMELINTWSHNARLDFKGGSLLGISKALPPLPLPRNTCQIIFAGKRWNPASIKAWATMNGYLIKSVKNDGNASRTIVHSPTQFVHGSFQTFSISREIKMIIGTRIKQRRGPRPGHRQKARL